MKNVIVGSGVVGQATGQFLESNGEEVFYVDTNPEVLEKLRKKKKQTAEIMPAEYDVCWICTHEDRVLDLLPHPQRPKNDVLDNYCKSTITVIRSTIPPATVKKIKHSNVIHLPEFLREVDPLEGTFFPDRVIIGSKFPFEDNEILDYFVQYYIRFFKTQNYHVVPMEVSSLVKIISNSYLAMEIGFWNEVYHNIDPELEEYRQIIANLVSMDHRIPEYGTKMIGTKFSGKCLPKDLQHLIEYTNSNLLKSIKECNEQI